MPDVVAALTLAAALGCGLAAGVFFAFSTFVMPALARLAAPQGIPTMQSINVITKDDDPNPLVDGQTLIGSNGSNLLPGQSVRIEVDEVRIGLAFAGKVKVSLEQVDAAILHVSRIIDRFERRIASHGDGSP